MRLIILLTVFLLASCTYPDMKGVYKEVNHRDSYRFSEKYGDYLFYRFYGHTKSLRQYEGTYFEKLNQLLVDRAKEEAICENAKPVIADRKVAYPDGGSFTFLVYCLPSNTIQ